MPRTFGPALGSVVVGIALGIITIIGVAQFSGQDSVPSAHAGPADEAVMGSPEYGSRG